LGERDCWARGKKKCHGNGKDLVHKTWLLALVPSPRSTSSCLLRSAAGHPHTIDRWDDPTGENLIGQIAATTWSVGDLGSGEAWPKDKITLRNRARIIERSWRD
jgi:hypothetical protein